MLSSAHGGISAAGGIANPSGHGSQRCSCILKATPHGAEIPTHFVDKALFTTAGNRGSNNTSAYYVSAEAANRVGRRAVTITGIALGLDTQHAAVIAHVHFEGLLVIGADVIGPGNSTAVAA